jgi:hypothetical protein
MGLRSALGSSGVFKHASVGGTVALVACSALFLAACGSSGKPTSATTVSSSGSAPGPTMGGSVTTGTSGSTALKACPTAAVVNAAFGQYDTGPVVSGTSVFEVCTYRGSGVVPTKVEISVGTRLSFKRESKMFATRV